MTSSWICKTDVDVAETLSVVLHNKNDFKIRRIPDVPYPSFFILSASVVIFYVTITNKLNFYVIMEKQRSSKPFIRSSKFSKKNIKFELLTENKVEELGCCIVKKQIVWDITKDKEKLYEIVRRSDGLSCRIVEKGETIGELIWDAWSASDIQMFNIKELPLTTSYSLKFNVNLDFKLKSLILVSTFVVHFGQKQVTLKKCTKNTTIVIIIGLSIVVLLLVSIPLMFYSLK